MARLQEEHQCLLVSPSGSATRARRPRGQQARWHCPLGIAALSVESVIILLTLLVVLGAWQARIHATSAAGQNRPAAGRAPEYRRPG
jgi:hypothetical protein